MLSNRHQSSLACHSVGKVTASLLLSFLAATPTVASLADQLYADTTPILSPLLPVEPPQPAEHTLSLRHVFHHGTHQHPELHRRRDIVGPEAEIWLSSEDEHPAERVSVLRAKSRSHKIERMRDRRPSVIDPMVAQARQQGSVFASSPAAWSIEDVSGPDVTDKNTILSMAIITANAYVEKPGMPDWEEVGKPFNRTEDFGWESDGLRGHIWGDETNSTIVIGLKGTSLAVFDGEGTTTNDKVNDNLFFSCCCGQQGQWTYHQVCNCATGTYQCNNTCVRQALLDENRYYRAARELYANVTELYPEANIWVAGHSLGGAVSSLLGLTYGLPVITFEAVPEAMAAGRLGLPVAPHSDPRYHQTREYTGTFHFGHTADPIFIGTCNGATASCSYAGYALESSCHAGSECTYDTVADKGWRVGIGTHKIRSVINDIIKVYDTVPKCSLTPECRDCGKWKMYESNSTDSTTSSSSSTTSKTRTRTATCQTPGWWGCLDETTTTGTTTTSTSSSTTTTCKTPGWFGCRDETTTTTHSHTSKSTTATPTTTCLTPGWFGCNDPIVTTTSGGGDVSAPPITPPPTLITSSTMMSSQPTTESSCVSRAWYGGCKEYGTPGVGEL